MPAISGLYTSDISLWQISPALEFKHQHAQNTWR